MNVSDIVKNVVEGCKNLLANMLQAGELEVENIRRICVKTYNSPALPVYSYLTEKESDLLAGRVPKPKAVKVTPEKPASRKESDKPASRKGSDKKAVEPATPNKGSGKKSSVGGSSNGKSNKELLKSKLKAKLAISASKKTKK